MAKRRSGHVHARLMSGDMKQNQAGPLHRGFAEERGHQSIQVLSQVIVQRTADQQVGLVTPLAS